MAEYQHLGATTPVKLSKISVERIISPKEVWEKYICPFCEHLLQEAVQSSCGHRVCRSCADEAFSKYVFIYRLLYIYYILIQCNVQGTLYHNTWLTNQITMYSDVWCVVAGCVRTCLITGIPLHSSHVRALAFALALFVHE